MRALVLTEASGEWGLGHVSRCSSYAQYLGARGIEVSWLIAGDDIAAACAEHEAAAEQIDWDSPTLLRDRARGYDIAIVDSYHASLESYETLAELVPHCLWLDDEQRMAYPRGLIVNPSAQASSERSIASRPGSRLLSGYAYQSLRPEFLEDFRREVPDCPGRILVMMGGTDPRGLTLKVVETARMVYPLASVDAVVASEASRRAMERRLPEGCSLHGRLEASRVRKLMEQADIAVSAGGQTLFEACRTGLPSVAICVAENQRSQAEALDSLGAIKLVRGNDKDAVLEAVAALLRELAPPEARSSLSITGPKVVDGGGTRRAIAELLGWSASLCLRPARAEDSRAVWNLSNLPSVREHSLGKLPIPWESHELWFADAISRRDSLFLIAVAAAGRRETLGQLRYRDEHGPGGPPGSATVSISLDPSVRGGGEASRLLREGDLRCFAELPGVCSIEALISPDNAASIRAFSRAGYMRQEENRSHDGRVFEVYRKGRENV